MYEGAIAMADDKILLQILTEVTKGQERLEQRLLTEVAKVEERLLTEVTKVEQRLLNEVAKGQERMDNFQQTLDEVVQGQIRIEERLGGVDKRLDGVDKRLDDVDKRLTNLERNVSALQTDVKFIKNETVNVRDNLEAFSKRINDNKDAAANATRKAEDAHKLAREHEQKFDSIKAAI